MTTANQDTRNLFVSAVERETQIIADLRACMDTLGEVISRSDVLVPLRNEIATRTYDLAVLRRQRDRFYETGEVIDVAIIRREYANELKAEFLCERAEKETAIEHSEHYYSRCPTCHSDNRGVLNAPCNRATLPNIWHQPI